MFPRFQKQVPRAFFWLLFAGAALGVFFAVYWPLLSAPFVFDDFSQVFNNRAIRYFFHPRALLESEYTRTRPLPYFTFAASYAWSGLSLSGLRIWSVVLHLGSAFLAGLLYKRWFDSGRGALLAGSIFLLHPLATDSVIYFSARGAVLVLFFLLLALAAHSSSRQNLFTAALFLFSAAMAFLSRETAVVLVPLAILLHRLYGRPWRALVPYLAPILAGGLFVLWMKWRFIGSAWRGIFTIQGEIDLSSPSEYFRLSVSLWPRILRLFVSPRSLSLDHQIFLPSSWLSLSVLGGILIWGMFLFLLFRAWRSRKLIWVIPSFFFLVLLPTNSFIPLLDPFSDRHFYIALPAFAWALAWALDKLPPAPKAVSAVVMLVLAATFTLPRALLWESPTQLWMDAYAKAPGKFRVAYNAAVSLAEERDDSERALRLFASCVAGTLPGGLTWEQQERGLRWLSSMVSAEASAKGQSARELAESLFPPGFWRELVLLRIAEKRGQPAWEKLWREARGRVGDPPTSARVRESRWVEHTFELERAGALVEAGRRKEAIQAYEKVILSFDDPHFPYWIERETLADLYRAAGREAEAVEQLELVSNQYKTFKRFPLRALKNLYELQLKRGDVARATDAIGEIVRAHTDDGALRRLYANLLAAQNDRHAARQALEAGFYEKNAVPPFDEREIVRP